ncbi:TIGR02206 family membrane protein [Romboutsia lituseburensis]|uniref:TMEM164-related integral membrane acyltransferase n=1 Tax=Romboutsia lituseburensis TaxID=1537 RepID=UPI00215A9ED2|nr:TIGR02206 family membrane protein [Romboutsia lituseburensis]MCR8744588.1 TIGR02206 family membrane protein [Romboutsia lituseburensis]
MKSFKYFFRGNIEHNNFIMFGRMHLFILFLMAIISIFILIRKIENRKIELFIGVILILQQIILYSWYFISDTDLFKEALPLYHCRVAIICIGLGLILNQKYIMKLGSYLGIFGSIAALLFPGLDPFVFPHVTQFSYFIGHLFLLWGSIYLLFVKNIGMTIVDFKNTIIFINVFHIMMAILNKYLGSNYAYISSSPINIGKSLNQIIYTVLVMMIFNLVLFLEYIFINKNIALQKKNKFGDVSLKIKIIE